MEKLVSVIIPVYEVEDYLIRCVDSIRMQEYQKLEIILVDDGSSDNCPVICDKLAREDSRIRVIHKTNGGLSSARNAGLDIARGDYIYFVDSDDCIDKAALKAMVQLATEYAVDIVVCDYLRFQKEKELTAVEQPQLKIETISSQAALRRIYEAEGIKYVVAWNKLYAAHLFQNVRYKEGKLNEDEFTTYRLVDGAKKIVVTNQKYYYYFYNGSSITTNERYMHSEDIYEAFDEAIAFYEKKNYIEASNAAKKAYLNRLIMRYRTLTGSQCDTQDIKNKYKVTYRRFKMNVPAMGYRLFYYSPAMYCRLLKILKK